MRKKERKGTERKERARRPEVEREEPQQQVHSARFHVWLNRRGCLWVREDLHSEQMVNFWLMATLQRGWGGNALDGNLNTMKLGPVVAPKKNQ
jgi:hypothetical protein